MGSGKRRWSCFLRTHRSEVGLLDAPAPPRRSTAPGLSPGGPLTVEHGHSTRGHGCFLTFNEKKAFFFPSKFKAMRKAKGPLPR